MYHAYQAHSDLLWPARTLAGAAAPILMNPQLGAGEHAPHRHAAAACEVFKLAEVRHRRPDWGIPQVTAHGQVFDVVEQEVHRTPFATLLRFHKPAAPPQPRVLIVAPMSGHFATLLRDTVRTVLADHDVYITDWHNARDVPLTADRFGLDEYIEHLMLWLAELGPGAHLMAICQPCVAGACGGGPDVRRRAPRHAGQPHADGRAHRLPHQPHRGQQAGHEQADRLVRVQPDQPRALALPRGPAGACTPALCNSRRS